MTDRPRLFLVDGSNIAFRAFFAIRSLSNSKGEPTNALFGFISQVLRLIKQRKPTHLALVFDPSEGSFRRRLYPDYKGHRPDAPPELRAQLARMQEMIEGVGLTYLVVDDFEADDVIGTLARRHRDECEVWIVSSDKDLMQLVDDRVSMLDTMKKDLEIGPDQVVEKFGVGPTQVADLLGLMGDSSDNIPGVRGVGAKTAAKLLQEHGTLEALYDALPKMKKSKRKQNLEEDRDKALLSRKLATIHTEVPGLPELDGLALHWPPRDVRRARATFRNLEFHRFMEAVGGPGRAIDDSGDRLVDTEEALAALAEQIEKAGRCALQAVLAGGRATRSELVGLSICASDDHAWYLPLAHRAAHTGELFPDPRAASLRQLPLARVRAVLGGLLADPAIKKIGADIKVALIALRTLGWEVRGVGGDPTVADYLLNPSRRSHRLRDLALHYLDHALYNSAEVIKKRPVAEVPPQELLHWACEPSRVAWLIYPQMEARLEELSLAPLYRDVELPLIGVLAEMEAAGVAVHLPVLERIGAALAVDIGKAAAEVRRLAGGSEFNMDSPKQLARVLFDELGLPVIRRTTTGPSTDRQVLQELSDQHPLPGAILAYRELVKLKNTYIDPIPALISQSSGRLHTSFNQTIAATGRLSSSDPNLQNIPIRTERGREIREAFIAPTGRILVGADYSQIELRVLAHLMGGAGGLARAFHEKRDVHSATAASVFDVPVEEVSADQRRTAKAINFGIIYGQSDFGLAQVLHIPKREARAYIKAYKERFPEVDQFHQQVLEEARERGFVETIFGRRRYFTDLHSGHRMTRLAAERTAINTPVQGSAADIIKIAMIRVQRELARRQLDAQLLLQVHDELLIECDEGLAEEVETLLVEAMRGAAELEVELVVDVRRGRNWAEVH